MPDGGALSTNIWPTSIQQIQALQDTGFCVFLLSEDAKARSKESIGDMVTLAFTQQGKRKQVLAKLVCIQGTIHNWYFAVFSAMPVVILDI